MKDRSRFALKWIYKYSGKQLWWVVFLSVITGVISLGFIWLALVSKEIIDIATGQIEGNLNIAIIKIVAIIVGQGALNVLYCNVIIRAVGKISIKMRQGLFKNLLNKKWTNLSKYHSGEILNRFTSDVDIVVSGVVDIMPSTISLLTRIISGLIVLFVIEPRLTILVLIVGIVVMIAARIYSKHFKYLHKANQDANGVVRSFIQECFENIIVIKSFANDNIVANKLRQRQNKALSLMYKKQTVSNIANTGVYILFTGGYYAALVWGALQISIGYLTFGTLTAFLQIIEQIKEPMKYISGLVPTFYSMIASAERLMELEAIEDEVKTNIIDSTKSIYSKLISIDFDNVSFAYDNDEVILSSANTSLKKGDMIAIAGSSGVGKSTLMKLILGLIEPQQGKVYINLKDGKQLLDGGYRRLFAYVPQGNMLLSGTLRDNICFCMPDASDEEVIKACEVARIWEFISTLPEGLNTEVGERGLGLSEGQIQRIAVARAILCDAPILLLDEATSALDEKTEKELIANIKSMDNKTCIIISHKYRTIKMCNRIISFDNNKLIDSTFKDLSESWN